MRAFVGRLSFSRHRKIYIILLGQVLLGMVLSPAQPVPFIDSWSYAWTARALADGTGWKLAGWSDMSLVAHVAWGTLFVRAFGFSFGILGFSTYLLATVGLVAFYLVLTDARMERAWALMATLAVAFNPIFFLLCRTFMTDVPFLAWMVLAMWAYARGFRRDHLGWLLLGSFFCGFSLAIRQNGVLVALSAGMYLFVSRGKGVGAKRLLAALGMPLATITAFFLLWHGVALTTNPLDQVVSLPELMGFAWEFWSWCGGWGAWRPLIFIFGGSGYFLLVALKILLYGGLFLLPLTLPTIPQAFRQARKGFAWWGGLVALGVAALAWLGETLPHLGPRRLMPYLRDLITPFGVGGENEWLMGTRPVVLPEAFWLVVTVLAGLSVVALLAALGQRLPIAWRERRTNAGPELFFYLVGAMQLAFFLAVEVMGEVFDRHTLVFFLPLAVACLSGLISGKKPGAGAAFLLVAFLVYSLLTSTSYFSWNRARWNAAQGLVAQGVAPLEVEAGFEWDGWQVAQVESAPGGRAYERLLPNAPWYYLLFPRMSSSYVVSFSPLPGYRRRGEVRYRSFLPWRLESLYILEREGS